MGEQEIFPSYKPGELLALLKEHAAIYTEGEKEPPQVEFHGDTSAISPDGKVLINPAHAWEDKERLGLTEEQGVRVLLDTLSHEIGHYNWTDLDSKRRFSEEYPRNPEVAGGVYNIVEDLYIDHNRVIEFEGLKRPFDWCTESELPNYIERMKEREHLGERMMDVLTITARGKVNCPVEPQDEFLAEFAEMAEEELSKVPDLHTQEERLEVAHTLTSTILDNVGTPEEIEMLEEFLDEVIEEIAEELELEGEAEGFEEMREQQQKKVSEHSTDFSSDPPEDCQTEEFETESEESEEDEDSEQSKTVDPESMPEEVEMKKGESNKGQKFEVEDGEEPTTTVNLAETQGEWQDATPSSDPGAASMHDPTKLKEVGGFASQGVELSEELIEALEEISSEEDTRVVKTQKGGNLDVRSAVRRKSGNPSEKVFKKEVPDQSDDAIGVTLDASGSMTSCDRMQEGLTAVAGLGAATQKMDEKFVANTFYSEGDSNCTTTTITEIGDNFGPNDLEGLETHSYDPMALGLEEVIDDIVKNAESGTVFAITDGNPGIVKEPGDDYSPGDGEATDDAVQEAIDEVHRAESFGIDVIGIAVGRGPNEEVMDEIFGDDWFQFDSDELAEKVITVYRNRR